MPKGTRACCAGVRRMPFAAPIMSKTLNRLFGAFLSDLPRIEAATYRRVRCAAVTADVLHDSWLKLASVADEAAIGNAGGFVRRVAQNTAIDHLRKERRRAAIDEEVHDLIWETASHLTPERIMMGRQAVEALRRALLALPEQSRRIFLMNRLDGKTHREIATQLGISETA